MSTANVVYQGDLRVKSTHIASGGFIVTDAPVDNHGKGEAFSPTDLVAAALGNCMLTVMGIKAHHSGWNIDNTLVEITKVMGTEPRRITQIDAFITFPSGNFDDKTKAVLEHTALTCPVSKSLHPDLIQNITFTWL